MQLSPSLKGEMAVEKNCTPRAEAVGCLQACSFNSSLSAKGENLKGKCTPGAEADSKKKQGGTHLGGRWPDIGHMGLRLTLGAQMLVGWSAVDCLLGLALLGLPLMAHELSTFFPLFHCDQPLLDGCLPPPQVGATQPPNSAIDLLSLTQVSAFALLSGGGSSWFPK